MPSAKGKKPYLQAIWRLPTAPAVGTAGGGAGGAGGGRAWPAAGAAAAASATGGGGAEGSDMFVDQKKESKSVVLYYG